MPYFHNLATKVMGHHDLRSSMLGKCSGGFSLRNPVTYVALRNKTTKDSCVVCIKRYMMLHLVRIFVTRKICNRSIVASGD